MHRIWPFPENASCSKNQTKAELLGRFSLPDVVVTVVYLLGFLGGWWHPGWLVFLTVPVYYCLVSAV